MRTIAIALAGLCPLLLSTTANADTQTAPFEPALEQTVAQFPWDSGFIPSSGPIRLMLGAAATQSIALDMPGDAVLDDAAGMMSFAGDQGGGSFTNTVGAEITATVAIDVLGFNTQVEVGLWGIEESVDGRFTPYVLAGSADGPLELTESFGPYELAATPVEIGPASGMLYIDWRLDIPAVSFSGSRIDLARSQGSQNGLLGSVVTEHQEIPMPPGEAEPGSTATIYGTQYGLLDSEVSLHLLPSLVLDIYGVQYEIGPFDLEVAYPLLEQEKIAFEQLAMEFDVPEAPPAEPEEPEDDDEPTDDDEPDDDEPEDDEGDDDEGDTDGGGVPADGFGGAEAEGCGCTADPAAPPASLLALLGLAAVRRRRRRRRS